MKLYTRTDLERVARLALRSEENTIEGAVCAAVDVVTAETPELFRKSQLEDAVRSAAYLALQGLPVEDVVKNVLLGVRA